MTEEDRPRKAIKTGGGMKPHVFVAGHLMEEGADPLICGYRVAEAGQHCRQPRQHEIHSIGRKPFGAGPTITCPFGPHGGTVYVRGVEPHALIEMHDMGYYNTDIQCPASLMHWPLGDAERSALAQQAVDLVRQFRRDIEEQAVEGDKRPIPGPRSQTLRHKGRIGREPENDSADWALGGRQDEDVPRQEDEVRGVVPHHVQGQEVGRGSMSISAAVLGARRAIEHTSEVTRTLQEMRAKLYTAKGEIAVLLGDGNGETLNNWMASLNAEVDMIDRAMAQANVSNEYGEQFINNISF